MFVTLRHYHDPLIGYTSQVQMKSYLFQLKSHLRKKKNRNLLDVHLFFLIKKLSINTSISHSASVIVTYAIASGSWQKLYRSL